jgi:hypothetical protein
VRQEKIENHEWLILNWKSLIWRQRYELSKQLQDLHTDVALLSETHLKPHQRFFVPFYYSYGTDCFPGRKGGTAVAVRKDIPHNRVDLPPLVSIEATVVCKKESPYIRDNVVYFILYEKRTIMWAGTCFYSTTWLGN